MKVRAAGNNLLRGTAQIILIVVVRGTDDILRTVKLLIVLVPGLKRNSFSTSDAAQKGVKTIIEKSGSFLDFGAFSVQLTRLNNTKYLDLTTATCRGTESAPCSISGETFGKESVLPALVPKKPVSLSVSRIIIDSVENKNSHSTFNILNTNEDVSFCKQVEGNTPSPTIDGTGRK